MAAVLMVSAIGAWAQDQCTDDLKTAKYQEWYDNRKDHQDVAYKAANDFLTACPSEPEDGAWGAQVKALKKFKGDYEKLNSNKELADKFQAAIASKNYADQVRLGKQLAAANPDNALIYVVMATAGLNDSSLLPDSVQAAKKAIELVEAGKPFAPAFNNSKDTALAFMNYVIAKATAKTSPADAIPYFIKAARYDSEKKKDAQLYNELAAAYGEQVDKLTSQYQAYVGKPETTESKLVLANLNQAIDAQIDALARATALAAPADKSALMSRLTELYKFRTKSDTGLNELVAGVLAKPLPDPPKPITELPATTTPGATSATPGTGSSGSAPTGGGSSSKPAATGTSAGSNKPPTSGTTTPAKPTATPTPKPRQRANHRG